MKKWNAKLAAATKALEEKQEAQQDHRQNQSLRVNDINSGRVKSQELVQKEAQLRRTLENLKAPQTESETSLLVMR